MDVMFVNGIAFMTILSRDIRLFTSGQFPYNTGKQLSSSLIKVTKYSWGGFIVHVILMDMEFEKVADEVVLLEVNTTAAQYHAVEIERGLITIKEYL